MMEGSETKGDVILKCVCCDHMTINIDLNSFTQISEYFERLQACDLKEMKDMHVNLDLFKVADIQLLKDFMNGTLTLSKQSFHTDVEKLLLLADYFRIKTLQVYCIVKIKEDLEKCFAENSVLLSWAFRISKDYYLEIEDFLIGHCVKNIHHLLHHKDFHKIPAANFQKILLNPDLPVNNEIETLNIFLAWCRKSSSSPGTMDGASFDCIHIPSITETEMLKILELLKNERLFHLANDIEAKYKLYMANRTAFLRKFPQYNFIRKRCTVFFAVGGLFSNRADVDSIPMVESKAVIQTIKTGRTHLYLDNDCQWSLPYNLCEFAVCILDKFLYVAGGQRRYVRSGNMARSEVFVLNPHHRTWSKSTPMREKRCLFYLGELEGHLIAVGGCNKRGVNVSTEMYSPITDSWTEGPTLPLPLHEHAGCNYGGKLYISGGHDNDDLSNRMLCLSSTESRWQECQPLNTARSYHLMTVIDNLIMVMGGAMRNLSGELVDCYECELYNPFTDQWTAADLPLIPKHYNISCDVPVLLDDRYIVCMGGYTFTYKSYRDMCHVFDIVGKTWKQVQMQVSEPSIFRTMCAFICMDMRISTQS